MEHMFTHNPSYTLLRCKLAAGEKLKAEAGAMVYMSPDISIETVFGSGILSAIARKFLGGESLFVNIFTASQSGGEIGIAPERVGDVQHMKMAGQTIMLQAGSYLCSSPEVTVTPKFGGLRSFFGGEGFFLLEVSGTGDLFFSSYGSIIPIAVSGSYVVDTGHIVAFENSLSYKVKKVGGWKSTFFSGEGLVCEFSGTGKLWIQSRVPDGFISWVTKLLPR
jgi:uncharacterized protein (TIGR00266 family)